MDNELVRTIVFVAELIVVLAVGGGLAAVWQLLRTRKAEVERAFLSLPPEVQANVLEILKTANDVAATAAAILAYLSEVTDGDMTTIEGTQRALTRLDERRYAVQVRLAKLKEITRTGLDQA